MSDFPGLPAQTESAWSCAPVGSRDVVQNAAGLRGSSWQGESKAPEWDLGDPSPFPLPPSSWWLGLRLGAGCSPASLQAPWRHGTPSALSRAASGWAGGAASGFVLVVGTGPGVPALAAVTALARPGQSLGRWQRRCPLSSPGACAPGASLLSPPVKSRTGLTNGRGPLHLQE